MKKPLYWVGMVVVAVATVACDGAQGSPFVTPTAPSASSPSSGSGRITPTATAPQAAPPCTPPAGADVHFRPAPSGTTPPAGDPGQPSCETREGDSGPSTNTGGTPPANPGDPDTEFHAGPGR